MAIVSVQPEAEQELEALPMAEEVALRTVMAKLEALGSRLSFLHQNAVRGATVRELRPRSVRSPRSALYRRKGNGAPLRRFDRVGGASEPKGSKRSSPTGQSNGSRGTRKYGG